MDIYKAINLVQSDLAAQGITKSQRNTQQGYNFRGIDSVFNALSPLLARHGLCILPRVVQHRQTERQTKSGGALFYTIVEVEFDFVSSADGSKHTIRTIGEAMDSADKSTNKAMSAAYKYAALMAFAIPTEADNDADATTHDVAAAPDIAGILRAITGSIDLDTLRGHFDAAMQMLPEGYHPQIQAATKERKAQLRAKVEAEKRSAEQPA